MIVTNAKININQFEKNIIDAIYKTVATPGKRLMKFTVEDIINEWRASAGLGSSDGYMAETFGYEVDIKASGDVAEIVIRGWSDPHKYHGLSFDGSEWASRHGYSDSEANLYVYSLQMYSGIIGLPEYANTWASEHDGEPYHNLTLGWSHGHNIHYHKTEPLITFLPNSGLWRKWENEMYDVIKWCQITFK